MVMMTVTAIMEPYGTFSARDKPVSANCTVWLFGEGGC